MRAFRVVAVRPFMWTVSFRMPMLGVCPEGFGEDGSGRASITGNCASGGEPIEQLRRAESCVKVDVRLS